MKNAYGAAIERGEIIKTENNLYIVQSITRDGVVTPAIGAIDGNEYKTGDRVYFFMFDDGRGKILTAI